MKAELEGTMLSPDHIEVRIRTECDGFNLNINRNGEVKFTPIDNGKAITLDEMFAKLEELHRD